MHKHLGYRFSNTNLEKVKDIIVSKEIGGDVDEVLQQLRCLKQVCKKTITDEYREHTEVFKEGVLKKSQVDKVIEKCKSLEKKLEKQNEMLAELSSCTKEGVQKEVVKKRIKGEVVGMLVDINDILQYTRKLMDDNDMQNASTTLIQAIKKLSFAMMKSEFIKNSLVFKHFQQTLQNYKKECEEILRKSMHENLCWGYIEKDGNESVTLRLKTNDLNSLVASLDCLGFLENMMTDFSDRLMRKLFEEVLFHGASVEVEGDLLVLRKGSEIKREENYELKEATDVLGNVEKVIEFIGGSFVKSDGGCIFLSGVGNRLGKELFDTVASEVVGKSNNDDIGSFEVLMKAVDQCKCSAAKFHLIQDTPAPSRSLVKEDAVSAFISCKCRHHLVLARTILKKPLHQVVTLVNMDGDSTIDDNEHARFNESKENNGSSQVRKATTHNRLLNKDNKNNINLSKDSKNVCNKVEKIFPPDFKHLFEFPECQISKSIQEYWKNIETMIEEAGGLEVMFGSGGIIIDVAIRHIIDLFMVLSSSLHQDEIDNLVFVAALHHNNSFYLAHQLILLQTKIALPQSTSPQSLHFSWVDMVGVLRELGMGALGKLLEGQKDQIKNLIKDEAVFNDLSQPSNLKDTQRCMRKVNMKLQHILKSSLRVLPSSVCINMIGELLDVMIKQVVALVTNIEDIPESDLAPLTKMVSQVHQDALTLFGAVLRNKLDEEDEEEKGDDRGDGSRDRVDERDVLVGLRRHVERWGSLQEVKWLLGVKLMEINERWANGKGPLADELSASEIERMIRALFKNTEMRSTVLASIKKSPS